MFAGIAQAGVTVPAGLEPGTQYTVIFTTADTVAATSSHWDAYYSFANQEFGLNPIPNSDGGAVPLISMDSTEYGQINAWEVLNPSAPI